MLITAKLRDQVTEITREKLEASEASLKFLVSQF